MLPVKGTGAAAAAAGASGGACPVILARRAGLIPLPANVAAETGAAVAAGGSAPAGAIQVG